MKSSKNSLILILMYSSIALLLILQFLWLRNAYTRAYDDLRRETDNIFRNTIFSMRDSIIQHTFDSMPDSTLKKIQGRRRAFWDQAGQQPSDTTVRINPRRALSFRGPDRGAIRHHDRPGERSPDAHSFTFRLAPDSLRIDSVEFHFGKAMAHAGRHLPFKIVRVRRNVRRDTAGNEFVSEPVKLNPQLRYAVVVSDHAGALARQIMPQALFSLFLTMVTIVSFYVLYTSIRRQQKLVELKNDFISNITHELKTPITTVGVALEALQNFQGFQNQELTREYLGIAQNELGRLTMLTDRILKTAVYEDRGTSFQMQTVDMEQLVNLVLASLRLVLEKSGAIVSFEKKGNDFNVHGDPDHLTNVIYNLIDNALKYAPAPPVLKLTLAGESTGIIFSVGDNGPGIPTAYHKKIFEKFFRIPNGDVHNVKGYGLGLSYVDSVVKGHAGTIRIGSNGETGSLFIITLPRH